MQPVQPCNRTHNRQVFECLSDCATGCTVAPVASDVGCWANSTNTSPNLQSSHKEQREQQIAAGQEDLEERAAILEYEAGLTRTEAETQALAEFPEIPDFLRRVS
jgi:hypothetical protein